ncbi:MAG: site-2 protease family protein [Clostridiaceae bacterium]|jgi:Zn-dependent protease|nr:site-2 protease family protein [Clostridiaceae bacterium]
MPLALSGNLNWIGMTPVAAALPILNFARLDMVQLLIMVFVMTLSLSFHEFAHAWMANRLGDDTAALAGRLTLNPLRHLDPIGSVTFLLVGVGWAKPVPVNPNRFTKAKSIKRGMFLTSLAGPMSNIFLGTIAWILFCTVYTVILLTSRNGTMTDTLVTLFYTLYSLNMLLAVFNLLPVPPLDGYRVFGVALPDRWYYSLMQYERYIGMIFLLLVLFGRGFLWQVLNYVLIPFNYLVQYPVTWLFQQLQGLLGLPQMPMFIG